MLIAHFLLIAPPPPSTLILLSVLLLLLWNKPFSSSFVCEGAELEALVLSATSFATNRLVLNAVGSDDDEDEDEEGDGDEQDVKRSSPLPFLVTENDLWSSLREVTPAFGTSAAGGGLGVLLGVRDDSSSESGGSSGGVGSSPVVASTSSFFAPRSEPAFFNAFTAAEAVLFQSPTSTSTSLLLHGPPGVGKRTFVRDLFNKNNSLGASRFPFVRVLTPDSLLVMGHDAACEVSRLLVVLVVLVVLLLQTAVCC